VEAEIGDVSRFSSLQAAAPSCAAAESGNVPDFASYRLKRNTASTSPASGTMTVSAAIAG
jgi:hypothetical protein